MLWSTLHTKIGKMNLSKSRHTHVTGIIDNKYVYLDIKYRTDGTPYFVIAANKDSRGNLSAGDIVRHKKNYHRFQIKGFPPDPNYCYAVNLRDVSETRQLLEIKNLEKEPG